MFSSLPRPKQTLNVKIDGHEFEAEGPPAIVLIQYNAWLVAIGYLSTNALNTEEQNEFAKRQ